MYNICIIELIVDVVKCKYFIVMYDKYVLSLRLVLKKLFYWYN